MAWHYKKYQGEQSPSDRMKYSDAELEARRHKIGLWHDPNPVPPWDYRWAERDQRKSMEPFVGNPRFAARNELNSHVINAADIVVLILASPA